MECETEPYYSGIMAQTAVIDKCNEHHDRSEMEREREVTLGRLDERVYEDVPDYIVRVHAAVSLKSNVAYASTSSKVY